MDAQSGCNKTLARFNKNILDSGFMLEKIVFLLTESCFENKKCSQIFGEHLAAIFKGMLWGLTSLIMWPRGATREKLQGDGWDLHTLVSV